MSDLEYYGTIFAFVAGFVLLVYLFRKRASIIKALARLRLHTIQEKTYTLPHNEVAPLNFDETINFLEEAYEEDLDPWGREPMREIR